MSVISEIVESAGQYHQMETRRRYLMPFSLLLLNNRHANLMPSLRMIVVNQLV